MPRKIGFLVNPVAGMGGSVALKGTDGDEILARARELGAVPRAGERMAQAIDAAGKIFDDAIFLTAGAMMGENLLITRGFSCEKVYDSPEETSADDTKSAACAMAEAGAELIFFAGGDGTARDLHEGLGGAKIPVIGVPAGVKIHSAVFGITPRRAGQLLAKFVAGEVRDFSDAEVMDIDEEAFRRGEVNARLFGYLKVPLDRSCLQDRKSGGAGRDILDQSAIGVWCADRMEPTRLYLIGSGTTTGCILGALGLPDTLLGVDAVKGGELLASDLTERQILEILEPGNTTLIVTVVGGQGHIFGRGNQQISPAVLRAIGPENVIVAATPAKLNGLFGRPLLADTGDPELDRQFCGYVSVVTGYDRRQMHRVEC